MDDDLWECLFIILADWRTVLIVLVIVLILSLFGVIPWNNW